MFYQKYSNNPEMKLKIIPIKLYSLMANLTVLSNTVKNLSIVDLRTVEKPLYFNV